VWCTIQNSGGLLAISRRRPDLAPGRCARAPIRSEFGADGSIATGRDGASQNCRRGDSDRVAVWCNVQNRGSGWLCVAVAGLGPDRSDTAPIGYDFGGWPLCREERDGSIANYWRGDSARYATRSNVQNAAAASNLRWRRHWPGIDTLRLLFGSI
jgi:hypothetical protein